MDFNIDEYKINGKKIYINGWAHFNDYKIKIISNNETKEIKNYESRYDISKRFHEKIEDNHYGFKEEVEFNLPIKKVKVVLETNKEQTIILMVDNSKIMRVLKKIKKILGKIKRGIKFLWREYHFLVPPAMMKKYIKDFFGKKEQITLYDPAIESEYNLWYEKKYGSIKKENKFAVLKVSNQDKQADIIVTDNNVKETIKNIKDNYVCLINGEVEFNLSITKKVEELLNEKYDLIYFDNDILNNNTLKDPMFKPDWAEDTLLGVNYIGNCFIIKTKILKDMKLKNWNPYEILLNLRGKNLKIKHLSEIVYHDKNTPQNDNDTLKKYIKETKLSATVEKNIDGITNTVIYELKNKPLVSIIIPTKDHADILENCLKSIYKLSTYQNYEIIVIDNNSEKEETFALLKKYAKNKNFRYQRIECEFNYSYLNNEAVKMAKGEYVVLLNNDIEVITTNWLELMLSYASLKNTGTVGAKLLFPDDTIQHAGIIMGKGGLAGHAHYGKNKDYISPQYELKIPYDVSACTAACLMVSKNKFNEVNGLEEKLKVAFNDVDFNLKLLDKGYNNIFLPNVLLYHYESKSRGLDTTPEKQKRFVQEWALVEEKWEKYIEHDPFYNDNFSKNDDYMLK